VTVAVRTTGDPKAAGFDDAISPMALGWATISWA
jgi:hypothetical protein